MSSVAFERVAGLQSLLNRCQRLIRMHAAVRGLAETVCVLIACLVFSCVLDYFITLPGWLRLTALAATIIMTATVAWKHFLRPVLFRTPDEELGAVVDLQFPALQESIATLISVESPDANSGEAGSLLMRQRLEQQVQSQIRRIRPTEVVPGKATLQRCALASVSMIAVLIPFLLWPSGSQLLVQRFVMPFANLAAASNLFFEVPDGNRIVPTSSDVEILAVPQWRNGVAGKLPTDVILEVQTDSGEAESLPMSYDAGTMRFSVTLNNVQNTLNYRISGGSAVTEWFELRVADPPRVLTAVLTETPPPYTGRPVEIFDGIVGDIPVFERSRIAISLTFSKPVQSARLEWRTWQPLEASASPAFGEEMIAGENQALLPEEIAAAALAPVPAPLPDAPEIAAVLSADRRSAMFEFEAVGSGEFDFYAADDLGLSNSHETTRRLIVTTDTPPQLTVTGITDGLEVRPDDIVPLNCGVVDDLGVGLLEVHFQKNTDAVRILPADPLDRGALAVSHEFRVDLKTLDAKAGDTVTFRVRAADDRPIPGPQVVWKGPWTVRLADDAEPLGQKPLREADQQLVDALRQLEEELQQDAQKSRELKEQVWKDWSETTQEDVRGLSEKEQTQGRTLAELARQTAEHPLMQKQASKLNELAQKIRQEVPNTLKEAAAADREKASQKLQDAVNELNNIREELHRATDEIEKLAQLEQELAELNRLALDAEQLARESAKLQEQQKNPLPEEGQSAEEYQQQLDDRQQQLEQEQQQLSNDLQQLLERKQELLQAAREAQLDQVAEVAEQTQRLARQQQQIAEGINEEARDTARDAQELANELQKTRNEAEQIGQRIQQQAQDVPRPELQALDDAIRELRQGNLNSPQQSLQEAQKQLSEVSDKLQNSADAKAKPADQNAPNQDAGNQDTGNQDASSEDSASADEASRDAAQDKSAQDAASAAAEGDEKKEGDGEAGESRTEQNAMRQKLGEETEQIGERLKQLEQQLREMAEKLGAKSDAAVPAENADAESAEAAEPAASDVSRSMLSQLERMTEAAHEQAEAVRNDPQANNSARSHSEQAAQRADDALRHAQAGQFNRSAERMRNAAGESEQASNDLNEPTQQDRRAQLQQQSESFRRMSETMQQLQQDNAAQVATQQDAQREVAAETAELPEPLNEVAERLNLPALGMQHLARPAQEAAQAAQEAAQAGQQASQQLDQTQMQQAGQTAQETAGHLNRAAQLAQQAAQGHRDPNAVIPSEVGESVNDAMHSLQKATELMNQEAAQRSASQQAQQSGEQGAQQSGEEGPEGQPGQNSEPGQSSQPGDDGQPGQPGQLGDDGQPGQPGQPGQNGQPGAEGQPGQGQQPGQPGQSSSGQGQSGVPGQAGQNGSQQGPPSQSSADQLAKAAKALQNAARGALPSQFSPGQLNSEGSNASSDPRSQGNPAQFDGRIPGASARQGKGRMWGQLQDELDNNLGDAGKEVLDNEYSELIRRYRRDLARSTDQDSGKAKSPAAKPQSP